jgi:hypothetical protein
MPWVCKTQQKKRQTGRRFQFDGDELMILKIVIIVPILVRFVLEFYFVFGGNSVFVCATKVTNGMIHLCFRNAM